MLIIKKLNKMHQKHGKKIETIDYYIFIDYSERLVGYIIIQKERIPDIIPLITKFHHYRDIKHKKSYIKSIKKVLDKNNIAQYLLKSKIKELKDNLSIFVEVIEFIKKYDNCKIFASIDNNQFNSFKKLLDIIPHKDHIILVKESDLKKGSVEYKLSLVIDTKLNIERMSK